MRKLPYWCIADRYPAFYDTESATAIEQTAKLWSAVNSLIEYYNKFVEDWNDYIEGVGSDIREENEAFAVGLRQEFQDFIDNIELVIKGHENYIKTDLKNTCATIFQELLTNGEIQEAFGDYLTELYNKIDNIESEVNAFDTELNKRVPIFKDNDTSINTIYGGSSSAESSGAKLELRGGKNSSGAGHFVLQAGTSNGSFKLVGRYDGGLTWGGEKVVTTKNITTVYGAVVEFVNGVGTYSHKDITAKSSVFVNRIGSNAGESDVFGYNVKCVDGAVTIYSSVTFTASLNLNMVIIDLERM